jgi:hypothetical protein
MLLYSLLTEVSKIFALAQIMEVSLATNLGLYWFHVRHSCILVLSFVIVAIVTYYRRFKVRHSVPELGSVWANCRVFVRKHSNSFFQLHLRSV